MVTRRDRALALRADMQIEAVMRRVQSLIVLGSTRALRAIVNAYREGMSPLGAVSRIFAETFQQPLVAAMNLARLKAVQWGVDAAPLEPRVRLSLAERYSEQYRGARALLDKRMKIPIDVLERMTRELQRPALRVLQGASRKVERSLQRVIGQAVAEGWHRDKGVAEITQAMYDAGVHPQNVYTAENIFRTQVHLAHAAGEADVDAQPEIQEILWGYTYVTVGDNRVRPTHAAMDGTTLPKADPFWRTNMAPNGWSCRCKTIRVFDERESVRPPASIELPNGKQALVAADRGFGFAPGSVFQPLPVNTSGEGALISRKHT